MRKKASFGSLFFCFPLRMSLFCRIFARKTCNKETMTHPTNIEHRPLKHIEVVAAVIFDERGRTFATQRGYGEWKD